MPRSQPYSSGPSRDRLRFLACIAAALTCLLLLHVAIHLGAR